MKHLLSVSLFVASAILWSAATVRAQCCGDCDGDGTVAINELVTAVGNALNGCGDAATPTRGAKTATPTKTPTPEPAGVCPYKFNQAVTSDRFCSYDGGGTGPCSDPFGASGGWATDGTDVFAVIVDEFGASVLVDGTRTSPTTAKVTSIAAGPDFDQPVSASGSLTIPSNTRFSVKFNLGTTCGHLMFDGTFSELLGDNAVSATGSFAGLRQMLRPDNETIANVQVEATDVTRARTMLQKLRNFSRNHLANFPRKR